MGILKNKEGTKGDQLHDNKETDGAISTSGIKGKLQKKCKYDNCLQFGFVFVDDSSAPDAQCVLCYQTSGTAFSCKAY
jgi:hypothetical protein